MYSTGGHVHLKTLNAHCLHSFSFQHESQWHSPRLQCLWCSPHGALLCMDLGLCLCRPRSAQVGLRSVSGQPEAVPLSATPQLTGICGEQPPPASAISARGSAFVGHVSDDVDVAARATSGPEAAPLSAHRDARQVSFTCAGRLRLCLCRRLALPALV